MFTFTLHFDVDSYFTFTFSFPLHSSLQMSFNVIFRVSLLILCLNVLYNSIFKGPLSFDFEHYFIFRFENHYTIRFQHLLQSVILKCTLIFDLYIHLHFEVNNSFTFHSLKCSSNIDSHILFNNSF